MTDPDALDRWDSALRHVLEHEDRDGLLLGYLESYAARIWAGAGYAPLLGDLAGVERYAKCLVLARTGLAEALASGRVPLAGLAAARPVGKGAAGVGWDLVPGFEGYGFVWPLLEVGGGLPHCLDLLWLDRSDPARWRTMTGLAGLLWWNPFGSGLAAAIAGERPLRLYRHPRAWLEACVARQRAWAKAGLALGPLLPGWLPPEGEDGTVAACVLDWRAGEVWDLFHCGGEAMTVACDDQDHGLAVKRKLGELLRAPGRPRVVKRASDEAESEAEAA